MTFTPETKIVSLAGWTTDFLGSPTLESRFTLPSAQDLSGIQNLKIQMETENAHGDIFVRLENTSGRYAQFNIGGDMTGDSGTRTHELEVNMESVSRSSDVAADFDPTDVVSIFIYMNDDTSTAGNPTVDKTTVEIGYDDEVSHTIDFQEGFSTILEAKYDKDSGTIKMPIRPVNPNTGLPINKTIVILSDSESQDFYDFTAPTPAIAGKIFGEPALIEYDSTDPTSGINTFNVLQSGGGQPSVPVSLGSFRNSMKFASHKKGARVTIPLLKGLIQEGKDSVTIQQTSFEATINQKQEDHETSIANQVAATILSVKTIRDDIQQQQDDYETSVTQRMDNFIADNANLDGEQYRTDADNADLDAAYHNKGGRKIVYDSGDILFIVKTQDYVKNSFDGIVKVLDNDGVTVLKTITKDQTTGLPSVA